MRFRNSPDSETTPDSETHPTHKLPPSQKLTPMQKLHRLRNYPRFRNYTQFRNYFASCSGWGGLGMMLTILSAPNIATTHLLLKGGLGWAGDDAHVPVSSKNCLPRTSCSGVGWGGLEMMFTFGWDASFHVKKTLSTVWKCGSCRPNVCLCLKMTPVCLKMTPPEPDPKQGPNPSPVPKPHSPPLLSYRVEMLSHSFHAKESFAGKKYACVWKWPPGFWPVAVSDSDFPHPTLSVSDFEFPTPSFRIRVSESLGPLVSESS